MKFYFSLVALVALLSACDPEEVCGPDVVPLDEVENAAVSGDQDRTASSVREVGQDLDNAGTKEAAATQDASQGVCTVNFPYDSSSLGPDAKAILQKDAAFLRKNPSLLIKIEGHCDARGTAEYNMALGERRAEAVRHYLISLGIEEKRMTCISYGKEKPLDPTKGEDGYALDRRAEIHVSK